MSKPYCSLHLCSMRPRMDTAICNHAPVALPEHAGACAYSCLLEVDLPYLCMQHTRSTLRQV